jgi:hypothetical protein
VLVDGNLDNLCHLAVALSHDLLDTADDLLHNIRAAFHLDGVAVGILLGELDRAREFATIVGSSGTNDNFAKSRA